MRSKLPYVGTACTAQSHGPWQPLSSWLGGDVSAYDRLSAGAACAPPARQSRPATASMTEMGRMRRPRHPRGSKGAGPTSMIRHSCSKYIVPSARPDLVRFSLLSDGSTVPPPMARMLLRDSCALTQASGVHMSHRAVEWYREHETVVGAAVISLLVIALFVVSFLFSQERAINRAASRHSSELLSTFLQGDTLGAPSDSGVFIRLANVHFMWSDRVYIDAGDMALRAVPVAGRVVDFDDPNSFVMNVQQSTVRIRPEVLEGMFNESVFNYPESKLRGLKVAIKQGENGPDVNLKGSINVITWIPFDMDTRLSVDGATNTLDIDVDHLKVMGFLHATGLIKMKPLHLDRLLTLPPNKSLLVRGNTMMVKPFGLFPPPRVNGTMAGVRVDRTMIELTFAGKAVPAPASSGNNYIYLAGGNSEFGRFRMYETNVLIRDQNPRNPFAFSLIRYADLIPRS